jgi:hypothetical protein
MSMPIALRGYLKMWATPTPLTDCISMIKNSHE